MSKHPHHEDEWIELTRIERDHRPVRESMRASSIVGVRAIDSAPGGGGAVRGTLILFDGGGSALVAEPSAAVLAMLKHEPGAA